MAITKTKPIRSTVKKALDYICNPAKTDDKILISSYMCTAETADLEWEFTRAKARSGGCQLARHLIQSFAPGEVDFDTAHEIGKQLADRVLGGKYEYVLSTHIDRGNIHNHIIFNTVSFKDFRRYQSNKSSYHFIRRCSDMLCKEYGLSIIEPTNNKGKSYIEYTADKNNMSWKTKLRRTINEQILYATDFDDFLKRMEQENYKIKQGKYLSFCAEGQQRFIRSKTLGEDYSEEAIVERIAGIYKPRAIPLLIDIQNNMKCQQSRGYEQWAKLHNLKIIARTFNYLQENNLVNYDNLSAKVQSVKNDFMNKRDEINATKTRITEVEYLIKTIGTFTANKAIVDKLGSAKSKEEYRRKNADAFRLYDSAKKQLQPYISVENKLPNPITLDKELNKSNSKLNKLYDEQKSMKTEHEQIQLMKQNIDIWLKPDTSRNQTRNYDMG